MKKLITRATPGRSLVSLILMHKTMQKGLQNNTKQEEETLFLNVGLHLTARATPRLHSPLFEVVKRL